MTDARTGGQLVADCLALHGADTVFTVPGESFLAVLDALYDHPEIRLVVCRQEGGAANMADAYGKLTGRPGLCMVTRGPGAANAAVGVHTAFQDSTPMVVLIGDVQRDAQEREAFQEVDFKQMYGPLAKWVARIDDPARVPELMSRAFYTAVSGRTGPVVLTLPEDMLTQVATATLGDPYKVVQAAPAPADMERMRALLARARSPFMIVGGGGWSAGTAEDMMAFAEANALPTGASFRCQDYFDNTHPCYAGHVGIGLEPALAARIKAADLLIVVGARLGEMTTSGYTLIDIPRPRQTLVHVHGGVEELGRVYQADLPINAGSTAFAAAARRLQPVDPAAWRAATAAAHAEYLATLEPAAMPGALDLGVVMTILRARLPADAIMTNGAGNYTGWLHRFYPFRTYRTQLAPTSGAMGYGVPSAVAAKLVHPGRTVVSFNGDGCFLMCGQELSTAVRYGLDPVFVVINNGMYGTIRMHQEREYPGRVSGTELVNPDFVAYAKAFGAHAELVEKTADFEGALERALGAGRASLLELRIDPDAITTKTTLSAIRAAAQKSRRA
ncbi:MAG TPA: thiamine pyrophosphate-binding protein [Candidatus Limnocylindria bacterium]|nr:thiamine pyrophosphate-binding protein [Candidatus Limnocylindria bacterium]